MNRFAEMKTNKEKEIYEDTLGKEIWANLKNYFLW